MCCEIMAVNPAIRASIRENKIHQMDNLIQVGAKFGMHTMNQSLLKSIKIGEITPDDALARSSDANELQSMIKRDLNRGGLDSRG